MLKAIKAFFAKINAEAKLDAKTRIISAYHELLAEDAVLVGKIEGELGKFL